MAKDTTGFSEEAKIVAKDLDTYSALYAVSTSKGGRALINALEEDIETAIDKLCARYSDMQEMEIRSVCADLALRRGMLASMANAKDNMEGAADELGRLTK